MSDNMAYQQAYSERYDGPFLNDVEQPVACNHFPSRRADGTNNSDHQDMAQLRSRHSAKPNSNAKPSMCAKVTMTIGVVALVIVVLAIAMYLTKSRK